MQSFTEGRSPRTCVVYGGASMGQQIRDLKRGCEIVVGTPGRIQDHISRGTLDISKIEYFILDEGDEMLDMGFIDDIEAIFQKANPASRILLFSATMPAPILKIAQKFMGEYEIVEEEGVVDEPLLIEQKYWVVRESEKIEALVRLIDFSDDFYGLVFTQTKMDADNVCRQLDERGYDVAALHGDIAQNQREKILARFRSKKTRILVATDVAARGIDITGLSHVVNYSLPFDGATYVHRIGRTGRAGSAGIAVTFVRPEERRKLGYMQNTVRKSTKGELKEDSVPTVEQVLEKKRARLFEQLKVDIGLDKKVSVSGVKDETRNNDPSFDDSDEIVPVEESGIVLENHSDSDVDGNAGNEITAEESSCLQAASLVNPPAQFADMAAELCKHNEPQQVLAAVMSVMYGKTLDIKRYGTINSVRQTGSSGRGSASTGDQLRLYVQLGRRDGYNPRAVADYFSDLLNIPGRLVDRIDISANFTLLSLPSAAAKKALELSKRDSAVPHMHIDTKDSGGFDSSRNEFHGENGFRGERRGGGRRDERGGRGKFGHAEKGAAGGYAGGSYKTHGRPNVHTPTERSGSAGLYKKRPADKAERF